MAETPLDPTDESARLARRQKAGQILMTTLNMLTDLFGLSNADQVMVTAELFGNVTIQAASPGYERALFEKTIKTLDEQFDRHVATTKQAMASNEMDDQATMKGPNAPQ